MKITLDIKQVILYDISTMRNKEPRKLKGQVQIVVTIIAILASVSVGGMNQKKISGGFRPLVFSSTILPGWAEALTKKV